jgi:hypothetical protein
MSGRPEVKVSIECGQLGALIQECGAIGMGRDESS